MIGIAEIGDKTQLLTFGFGARYPFWKVVLAVSAATLVFMAVAVGLGGVINRFIPVFSLQLTAGLSFLAFGVWTFFDSDDPPAAGADGKNQFWLVGSAFFLAEFGDRTQLAALVLSARYGAPVAVWLGASLGMIGVNLLSVLAGRFAHGLVEPRWLKYGGAAVFLYFGLTTLYPLFL